MGQHFRNHRSFLHFRYHCIRLKTLQTLAVTGVVTPILVLWERRQGDRAMLPIALLADLPTVAICLTSVRHISGLLRAEGQDKRSSS